MGRFVLLNALGRGAKTTGQAEPGLPNSRKVLRVAGSEVPRCRKQIKLQAKIVGVPILHLWLMTRYFTGSVNWITDLTPYLPQDVAGHYEEKMTQVSVARSAQIITLNDWKCAQYTGFDLKIFEKILQHICGCRHRHSRGRPSDAKSHKQWTVSLRTW
ncbi:hypothetical protein [Bradyrhizobium ganzhouense]|uniref:hypothetical protein n=1 Tax=Bradyrhizobium ganzhouense TaxID=1179767 RepID=UPI003CE97BD0